MTAKITGFVNVTPRNIDAMKIAIAKHGPISVAIDASHKTFSFYSHGVYYDPACGMRFQHFYITIYKIFYKFLYSMIIFLDSKGNTDDKLDHAVLAIGYGTMNGKGYWLIKNSWSNYWGNDGYILIAQKDDDCGVLLTPTYVTM